MTATTLAAIVLAARLLFAARSCFTASLLLAAILLAALALLAASLLAARSLFFTALHAAATITAATVTAGIRLRFQTDQDGRHSSQTQRPTKNVALHQKVPPKQGTKKVNSTPSSARVATPTRFNQLETQNAQIEPLTGEQNQIAKLQAGLPVGKVTTKSHAGLTLPRRSPRTRVR